MVHDVVFPEQNMFLIKWMVMNEGVNNMRVHFTLYS